MVYFLIRRFLWAIFLFFCATVITYIIFFVIPSDPAAIACGTHCTPQLIAHVRHSLHLDLPIYQQYWLFVWNLLRHGSLGYSYVNGVSVRWIIGQDAPVTASLVFGGAVFWIVGDITSIPLLAALWRALRKDETVAEDAAQDRLEVVEVEYAPGDGSAQERFRPWWETDPELSARFGGTSE